MTSSRGSRLNSFKSVDHRYAWLTPAVRAAKQATNQIPIVMAGAGDPVATGVVASLVKPGGNITGMAGAGGRTFPAKRLSCP